MYNYAHDDHSADSSGKQCTSCTTACTREMIIQLNDHFWQAVVHHVQLCTREMNHSADSSGKQCTSCTTMHKRNDHSADSSGKQCT